jgi:hypothetical protein
MKENDKFQKLIDAINALKAPKNPKREAFEIAQAAIDAAVKRGVPMEEIAKTFAEIDVEMSTSTLRQYWREDRPAKKAHKTAPAKVDGGKGRPKRANTSTAHADREAARPHSSDEATPAEMLAQAPVSANSEQS